MTEITTELRILHGARGYKYLGGRLDRNEPDIDTC